MTHDIYHFCIAKKFEYYKKLSFIEHLSSASISFWRSPCCDWLRRQIMEWQWPSVPPTARVSSNLETSFCPVSRLIVLKLLGDSDWCPRTSNPPWQVFCIQVYLKLFPKISHKILKDMDGWHWCCNYMNHSISVALLRSYCDGRDYLVLVTIITVMQRQYIYYKRRKK